MTAESKSPAPCQTGYDLWARYYAFTEGDRAPMARYYASLVMPGTRTILDLGCGTGTITAAMAAAARDFAGPSGLLQVTGVDLSRGMLDSARRNFPQLDWLEGDITHFSSTSRFDLVTCTYNTVQMLPSRESARRILAVAREHLAPGGRFAFDIFRPNPARLRARPQNRLVYRFTDDSGAALDLHEDTQVSDTDTEVILTHRLVEEATGATKATMQITLQQYSHDDITCLINEAGLAVTACHGDFDRSPFSGSSLRQVFTCTSTA